jgi:WD40 repeat protein
MFVLKKFHLEGHRASIYCLDHFDEPHTFISAGGDGLVVKWDMTKPKIGHVVAQVQANIYSVKYIKPLNRLVIGNMFGGIHWIDVYSNENIKNVAHHENGVFALEWIKGHIYSGGGKGKLTKWSAEECRPLETLQLSNASIRCIDYSPVHDEIAVGSSDYSIYILDANTLSIKRQIPNAHANSVFTLRYSPNGKYLMSGGRDAHLKVWDIAAEYELKSMQPAHWFTINQIVFSPDGEIFATASRDKSIKFWYTNNFRILKVIDRVRLMGHSHSVNSILWSEYNNWIASAGDDKTVMGWELVESERFFGEG